MKITSKDQLDYKKYRITGYVATFIQHISIVPIFYTALGYYIASDDKYESVGIGIIIGGRLLNMLLCSAAVAAGFAMLYKSNKINLINTIGLSIAFPLLWVTSSFVAYLICDDSRAGSNELENFENDMKNFLYFNPIFAALLPGTMLLDVGVNAIAHKARCMMCSNEMK